MSNPRQQGISPPSPPSCRPTLNSHACYTIPSSRHSNHAANHPPGASVHNLSTPSNNTNTRLIPSRQQTSVAVTLCGLCSQSPCGYCVIGDFDTHGRDTHVRATNRLNSLQIYNPQRLTPVVAQGWAQAAHLAASSVPVPGAGIWGML